jgi:hypothetical protein
MCNLERINMHKFHCKIAVFRHVTPCTLVEVADSSEMLVPIYQITGRTQQRAVIPCLGGMFYNKQFQLFNLTNTSL